MKSRPKRARIRAAKQTQHPKPHTISKSIVDKVEALRNDRDALKAYLLSLPKKQIVHLCGYNTLKDLAVDNQDMPRPNNPPLSKGTSTRTRVNYGFYSKKNLIRFIL